MNEVKRFLKEAYLEDYWPAFERDATTVDRLFLILAKKAEELPKWGDQAEFFSRINALQANISKNLSLTVEVDNFRNCTLSVIDADTYNSFNTVNIISCQSDDKKESYKQKSHAYSEPESATDSEVNSVYCEAKNNLDCKIEVSLADGKERKRQLSSKSLQSKRYPKRLALWVTRMQFEELNIEKEIKEHLKGDAVIIYYINNGMLNGEARGILVNILASCMIKNNINHTFEEFQIVSKKICKLFPTETETIYGYELFANGPNQKNIGGKLADKVPGDINPAIQRRRVVTSKLKTRIQPFVILVGPTVEEYEACYLIIDKVKYQFNNVLYTMC